MFFLVLLIFGGQREEVDFSLALNDSVSCYAFCSWCCSLASCGISHIPQTLMRPAARLLSPALCKGHSSCPFPDEKLGNHREASNPCGFREVDWAPSWEYPDLWIHHSHKKTLQVSSEPARSREKLAKCRRRERREWQQVGNCMRRSPQDIQGNWGL